ncbi:hypothetical protein D9M69_359310 [compost metagenome]
MDSGVNHSSPGTMRKPPPTPISPDSVPTPSPSASNGPLRTGPPPSLGVDELNQMRCADHSTSTQKPTISTASGT